jgi:hypothetical protein
MSSSKYLSTNQLGNSVTRRAEVLLLPEFSDEVSGHNLENSQTLGFCMDFLNHRERVWFSIRFSSSLHYNVQ